MLRFVAPVVCCMFVIGFGLAFGLSSVNLAHNLRNLTVWYNSGIMAAITGLACIVCLFAGVEFATDFRLSVWLGRKWKSRQNVV